MIRQILFCVILVGGMLGCVENASADLQDPTQPTKPLLLENAQTQNAAASSDGLQLDAVIYSPIHPVVIINGMVLGMNDVVSGYTVKQIDRQSVELLGPKGKKTVLKLDVLDIKKFQTGK